MTLREDHFVTVANLWARTQEVIEASGHLCIFLLKFHCELNFIEYFWGAIKKFQCDHCTYTFKTLQEHLPKALESVAAAKAIRKWEHWMWCWLEVYDNGLEACEVQLHVQVQLTKIQVTLTGPGGYET